MFHNKLSTRLAQRGDNHAVGIKVGRDILPLLVIIAMLQLVPPKVVGIVVDGVTEQHFTTGQILMWIATMVLIAVVV